MDFVFHVLLYVADAKTKIETLALLGILNTILGNEALNMELPGLFPA